MLDHQQQQCVDNIAFILLDQLLAQTDATFHGYQTLKMQISDCVTQRKPITLLLPAFPCKTNNLDKVLGHLPDLGEYRVLRKFIQAIRDIQSVYSPGVMLYIFSDYHTFSDYIHVDLEHHYRYSDGLRNMVENMNASDCVKIINFEHFPAFDDLNEYQYFSGLKQRFGDPAYEQDFARLKQHDHAMHCTYLGLKKFMHQDQKHVLVTLSHKARRERLSEMAKGMMVQGRALDNFLNAYFSHAIRLSIHEHPMQGHKYSLFLFEERAFKTPWHTCVLFDARRGEFVIDTQQQHRQQEGVIVPVTYQGTLWCLLRLYVSDAADAQLLGSLRATLQAEQFGLTLEWPDEIALACLPQAQLRQLARAFSVVRLRGARPLSTPDQLEQWLTPNGECLPEKDVASALQAQSAWFGLSLPSDHAARDYSYSDTTPDEWAFCCTETRAEVALWDASLAALRLNGAQRASLQTTLVTYAEARTYPLVMRVPRYGWSLRWSPALVTAVSFSGQNLDRESVTASLAPALDRSAAHHVMTLQSGDVLLVNNHTTLIASAVGTCEGVVVRQPISVNSPWQAHNQPTESRLRQTSPV
ncbi:L-tyrosine/L-tryptophan isonitrile synthase family protein [Vibrio proteolyticus]|mgnify:CR=1 FL=1|uniref:L-tyrosine/L-tryptophan isonitrile synthase family protein n=1 Tax=Vibrio proteolyticus NBRC 13287 TaxID=1219065 RepID=U3B9M0_VIBPR|nr:L-tyrosine/L-tryptophan isonitrile synthase family protein [Vibrio proteolyticus]GAD66519.1 hypothetical protein VPR01S_04_01240 [Vibrio proteolyticus NBRC 13287]